MGEKKVLIAGAFIVVIVLGGILFYVLRQRESAPLQPIQQLPVSSSGQPEEKPAGLGGQLYEKVENPAEKLPETNPFEKQRNVFEEAKTNPFEEGYKNPFE